MDEPAVATIMRCQVYTAYTGTSFREVAESMLERAINALPVIDATGVPVGVICARDVLAKLEFHGGTDFPPLLAGWQTRKRWHRASALTAGDLMRRPAMTIGTTAPISAAVRLMASAPVYQLCVVGADGLLVGVVGVREALAVFVRRDGLIACDVQQSLQDAVPEHDSIQVNVDDGVASLRGAVRLRSTVDRAGQIAQRVLGVIGIRNHLAYEIDDTASIGL